MNDTLIRHVTESFEKLEEALAAAAARQAAREEHLRCKCDEAVRRAESLKAEVINAYAACEERIRQAHAEVTAQAEARLREVSAAIRDDAKATIAREREQAMAAAQEEIESVRRAAQDEIESVRLQAREDIHVAEVTGRSEAERLRADLEVSRRERDVALRKYGDNEKLLEERRRVRESLRKTDDLTKDIRRILTVFGKEAQEYV